MAAGVTEIELGEASTASLARSVRACSGAQPSELAVQEVEQARMVNVVVEAFTLLVYTAVYGRSCDAKADEHALPRHRLSAAQSEARCRSRRLEAEAMPLHTRTSAITSCSGANSETEG